MIKSKGVKGALGVGAGIGLSLLSAEAKAASQEWVIEQEIEKEWPTREQEIMSKLQEKADQILTLQVLSPSATIYANVTCDIVTTNYGFPAPGGIKSIGGYKGSRVTGIEIDYKPVELSKPGLTRIMHHLTLFCTSGELTRAVVPSRGIGVGNS